MSTNNAKFYIDEHGRVIDSKDTLFLVTGADNESAINLYISSELSSNLVPYISFKRADGFVISNRAMTVLGVTEDSKYYEFIYIFKKNDRVLDVAGSLEVSFKVTTEEKTIMTVSNAIYVRRNIQPNLVTKTEEEFYAEAIGIVEKTQQQANSLQISKLDKSTNRMIVYGTDTVGTQKEYSVNILSLGNTIPIRTPDGQIIVSEPKVDSQTTNKKYVDETIHNNIKQATQDISKSANEYTNKKIQELINMAPENLDTLKELADAYLSIGITNVGSNLTEEDVLKLWDTLSDGRYTLTSKEYGNELMFINKTNNEFSRMLPSGKVIAYDFEEKEWVQVSGGGGGGDSSIITITPITPITLTTSILAKTIIRFSWVSGSYGNGMIHTYINGTLRSSKAYSQGEVSIDISSFLNVADDYAVKFIVEDAYGNKRTIIYQVSVIELSISSTFSDEDFYNSTITFDYKVDGNVDKTIHFVLDDKDTTKEVSTSGQQEPYYISYLSHGVHKFKVYATAKINGVDIKSNELNYNIIFYENENPKPIISTKFQDTTITEGDNLIVNYIVFNATNLYTPQVKLIVNNETKEYTNIDRKVQQWRISDYIVGTNTIQIEAINVIDESSAYTDKVSFTVKVEKGDMNVSAETNNLLLYLNSSIGKTNNDSDRNIWTYNGITTTFNNFNWNTNGWLLDKNNVTALKLNGDARAIINYAPFEHDIKTNGITIELEFSTSNVLNYDNEIINIMANNIGISVKPTEFIFKSLQKEVRTGFKEDEHIRIALTIQKQANNRFIQTYINGVLSGIEVYGDSDSFDQLTETPITIGSNYCDVNIYKIRIYRVALEPLTILNNYIADMEILTEKQKIYNRNQILNSYGNVFYEYVRKIMPVLTITCDLLPDAEDVENICSLEYENILSNNALNFQIPSAKIKVQGTSSLQYPYKNFDFTLPDDVEPSIQLYANAIKEKKITLKVDYASSAGVYNAGNAKIVNSLYQEKNPAQEEDSRVRNTIYGIPVAVFYRSSLTDNRTFHCKGSLNTSKLSNALGYQEGDESWSTENSTSPLCLFDSDDFTTITTDFKARYPKENASYDNLKDLISWVYSCKNNPDKFKNEVEQHFNLYYLKMYYIYFMVMGGIDSMAKNMYLTYFAKEGKWYPQFYDMDSAFGIDNTGRLSFNYNIEPLDKVGNDYAYNGSLSVLWNLVKEAYKDEIKELYQNLRYKKILTYEKMMDVLYGDGIGLYPENIYNKDTEIKYIQPYLTIGKNYLSSALGSTLDHLKFWISNRINYLDSKWLAEDYLVDRISCRITTPESATPDYSLSLKSYRDLYMQIQYGSYYATQRAERNKSYVLNPSIPTGTKFNDTETYIYGASSITEMGDLSKWYLSLFEGANAIKLSKLILGNPSSSYSNSNLKTLTLCTTESAPNYMMRYIDIRNCIGLEGSLDLSKLYALETLYAEGTKLTSIEFSNGGNLKVVHLPNTVNTLTMLNQNGLTDFEYDTANLVNVRVENSNIDTLPFIQSSLGSLNRVRLVGINWTLNDTTLLNALLTKKGYADNGANYEKSVLAGRVHINATIYSDEIEDYQRYWGNSLIISANNIIERYACRFYNDDVLLDTQHVLRNQDVTYGGVLPTKEYTGDGNYAYKFIGWDKPLTNITKSTNFYAQFELVPYHQVVFQDYLGNVLSTKYVPDGTLVTYDGETPTKPTDTDKKEKYVFIGWTPSLDLPITQNTIFTPQFNVIKLWTVTWQNWDNTLLYTELVENGKYATYVGETPTRPNDAQYGYTFAGWQPNNETTPITSDTTFTAGFSVEVLIKIQYLNWDGTVLQEFGVKKGESYSYTGPTPTRPDNEQFKDYVFIRFDPDQTTETLKSYRAYFEGTLRVYNVYWYSEGQLIELDSNVSYGATAEYNGVTPTHSEGYTFAGWGTDDFTVTSDMYFYAVFDEPSNFKIKVNNATVTPNVTVRGISDTYNLTINWGDGTTDTYTLTSGTTTTCTKSTPYQNTGEYNVTIPANNEFEFFSTSWAQKLFYTGKDNDIKIIEAYVRKTSINNAKGMFYNQNELIKLRIPNDTTKLSNQLCQGASSLNDFIFPKPKDTNLIFDGNSFTATGLESITLQENWQFSGMAFIDCKVKVINVGNWIPSSTLSTISGYFKGSVQIEQINVSNENNRYAVSDGVLYNKTNNTVELICHQNKEVITLGTPYIKIGDSVFAGNKSFPELHSKIKKAIFKETINKIGSDLFENNLAIEYVDFKETTITDLSSDTFYECKNLKEILFPPTLKTCQNGSLRTSNPNGTIFNFSGITQVPTLANTYGIKGTAIIPDNLYDEWIVATNWNTLYTNGSLTFVKESEVSN